MFWITPLIKACHTETMKVDFVLKINHMTKGSLQRPQKNFSLF